MGQTIESLAKERGHEIVGRVDNSNEPRDPFSKENTDVAQAIEKAVRANAGLIAEIIADPEAAVGEEDDDGGASLAASGE